MVWIIRSHQSQFNLSKHSIPEILFISDVLESHLIKGQNITAAPAFILLIFKKYQETPFAVSVKKKTLSLGVIHAVT